MKGGQKSTGKKRRDMKSSFVTRKLVRISYASENLAQGEANVNSNPPDAHASVGVPRNQPAAYDRLVLNLFAI